MLSGRTKRVLVVAVLAIAPGLACREDGPIGPARECPAERFLGAFSGTTGGAATESLEGCAYYTISSVENITRFGMVLTDGVPIGSNGAASTATASIKIQRNGGRPAGTISAGPGQTDFFGTIFLSGDREFVITGGTITFGVRHGDVMTGVVNLTGTDSATGATITVDGSFTAACVGEYPVCGGAAG